MEIPPLLASLCTSQHADAWITYWQDAVDFVDRNRQQLSSSLFPGSSAYLHAHGCKRSIKWNMQLTRKCLTLPTALDVWACLTLQLTIPSADVGLKLHLQVRSFRAWFCLLQHELVHRIIQSALCLPDPDFNDPACL